MLVSAGRCSDHEWKSASRHELFLLCCVAGSEEAQVSACSSWSGCIVVRC